MINLLPKTAALEMSRLYKKRLIACGLVFLFFVELISIILIAPTIFTEKQRLEVVTSDLAKDLARPISKQADEISTLVKETNAKLTTFDSKNKGRSLIEVINRIFTHKIEGITIFNINLDQDGAVLVRGVASKRNTLLTFIKSFESDSYFSEVVSPRSNLITTSDIDFSVELKLTKRAD
jgi:hypothetical protein